MNLQSVEWTSVLLWIAFATAIIVGAGLLFLVVRFVRNKRAGLDTAFFMRKWREMQRLCSNPTTWGQAVIDADNLLEEALKKKHLKGKTEGERLTKAQRMLTDNSRVWFGHKLRVKIESNPAVKLTKKEVRDALLGIRQALKDLGAFPDGK